MFRLVMCPKCRQVLPELPNVPLYRCGGCGALLQAKNRKVEAKRRESEQQQTNIEVMKDPNHEPKASPDSPEDYNNVDHQDGYGEWKREDRDMEGLRVESDVYSSTELRDQLVDVSMRNADSERQHQHQPPGKKKPYLMEEKRWDSTRVKRNDWPRSVQDGYGSGSFSSHEQTKLLRAIHELQDKLDRIRDIPTCYNHHCCHCHPQEMKLSVPLPPVLCHGMCERTYCNLRCGACSTIPWFSVQNTIPHSSPNRSSNHAYRHGCRDDANTSHGRNTSHASSMKKVREFPVEAARPSKADKCSSEIRVKKQQNSRSPLHRLMGYSSPSLLIRGTGLSAAATSS